MSAIVVDSVRVLEGLGILARNLSPGEMLRTMSLVNVGLQERTRRTYGQNVQPDQPDTVAEYNEPSVLVNTGALRASLTDSGATGAIREATPRSARYGTSIPYARYIQNGTSKMPARPIVKLDLETLKMISEIAERRIWAGADFMRVP